MHTPEQTLTQHLLTVYQTLHLHYGHEPHWWPIFTHNRRWEIFLGAVLVQQTHWERVEAAMQRLDALGLVDERALAEASPAAVVEAIRPVAFYNAKAAALQHLARYVVTRYDGDVARLLDQPTGIARHELLGLPHIGPETADAILLYAGGHAVFVVDAYLRRVLGRLGVLPGAASMQYEALRQAIESALPETIDLSPYAHLEGSRAAFFWDFHALIVEHGIHHCLALLPRCDRPSAPRRRFTQPIKCAAHCLDCTGCPLRLDCKAYQHGLVLSPAGQG